MLNTCLLKDEDCNDAIYIFREINKYVLKDKSAIERWEINIKGWRTILKTIGKMKILNIKRYENPLQEKLFKLESKLQKDPKKGKFK